MRSRGGSLRGKKQMLKRVIDALKYFFRLFFTKEVKESSLFKNTEGITSSEFKAMSREKNQMSKHAREFCEGLWHVYEPYADSHFHSEIRLDGKFQDRFWEMHLGNVLLEKNLRVSSKDYGPDFLVEIENEKLWVEAITASNGELDKPDSLHELEQSETAVYVDDRKVVLRLRSAIESKSRKINKYLKDAVIDEADSVIIAVNTGKIDSLLAVEFLGYAAMACFGKDISLLRMRKEETFENVEIVSVQKSSGSDVPVNIFLSDDYRHISGVLFSKARFSNYDQQPLNADYLLVCNPRAQNRLHPDSFKLAEKLLVHPSDTLFHEIHVLKA